MSDPILPLDVWPEGIAQARIPANDNALRAEVLSKGAISVANSEPGSPDERDVHIVGTTWGGFSTDDVVIYVSGSWLGFTPFDGWLKAIGTDAYIYDGSGWEVFGGGGGSGDVVGPASSTTGNFALFADGTGKEIEDGGIPGEMAFIDDAPSDSQEYVRKDGAWAEASGGGGGGLTNWTEAANTSSPNGTIPAVSLTVTNAATHVDAVIAAKGDGATSAQVPDSTATGGNKRGLRATDLQKSRGSAAQAATGERSGILCGISNTASNTNAVQVGGQGNTSSGSASGGVSGNGNTSSGTNSFVGGGASNTASGTASVCAGGDTNIAGGTNSWCPGGAGASTRGITGAGARGSGAFSVTGDAQSMCVHLRRVSTDATPVDLTSTNSSASSTNQLVLPNQSAYLVRGMVIAKQDSAQQSKSWEFVAHVMRGANAASTTLVAAVTPTVIAETASATTWSLAVSADTTNGGLKVAGTGAASTTIRWVCDILSAVQVAG